MILNKLHGPIWIAGMVLPPLLMAFFILHYGVNVPFWDQWTLVPFLGKYENGTLGFADLWAQHNEHRLLFPKMVMIGLAHFTGWNILYELYTNLILACCIYLFLYLLLKGMSELNGRGFLLWSSVYFSWMVFSTTQFYNWLWGWQLQWFLNVLGLLVAVWALTLWPEKLPRWQGLFVGILGALIGTFSLSSGVFIWVAGGFILIVREGIRKRFWVWTTFALGSVTAYFVNYVKPAQHPSLFYFAGHPGEYLHYVLLYVGSPLIVYLGGSESFFLNGSALVGLLLLVLFVASAVYLFFYHSGLFEKTVAWFALALYVLLTAAATGLGRAGFGVGQALASRYLTISILFVMSTVVLVSIACLAYINRHGQLARQHVAVLGVGGTLIIASFVFSYLVGIRDMSRFHSQMVQVRSCLEYLDNAVDPCLNSVYPGGEKVWERVAFLRNLGWGGLKPIPILPSAKVIRPTPTVGWLEKGSFKDEGLVEVSGWANPGLGSLGRATVILISMGHIMAQATVGLDRPDVARIFSREDMLKSGWKAAFYSSRLQKGEHNVTAYLVIDKENLSELNGKWTFLLE